MKEKMETLKKFETLKKITDLFTKLDVDIKSVDLESLENFVFKSQETAIYLNSSNTIMRLRNEDDDKIDFDLTQKASEVDEKTKNISLDISNIVKNHVSAKGLYENNERFSTRVRD